MQKRAYLDYRGERLLPLNYEIGSTTEQEFENFKTALDRKLAKDVYFRKKVIDFYPIVERYEVAKGKIVELDEDSVLVDEETLDMRFASLKTTPAKEKLPEQAQVGVALFLVQTTCN
jgi:hypothetical protein